MKSSTEDWPSQDLFFSLRIPSQQANILIVPCHLLLHAARSSNLMLASVTPDHSVSLKAVNSSSGSPASAVALCFRRHCTYEFVRLAVFVASRSKRREVQNDVDRYDVKLWSECIKIRSCQTSCSSSKPLSR